MVKCKIRLIFRKMAKFFAEKYLTMGSKRRIKPFAPTSWPRPKGRREKKFSRMAKKFLTRVWKWDISLPRANELSRRGREKTFAKLKKTCWQRKRSGVNNCFAPSESVWFIDKWIANGKELWDSDFRPTEIFATDLNWRVWFWLRLNAGGVLNTCKSYAKGTSVPSKVAHGWVTRG